MSQPEDQLTAVEPPDVVEVDIPQSSKSSDLTKDITVQDLKHEQPWHSSIETKIMNWRDFAEDMAEKHALAGYHHHGRKTRYGLIPIVLPMIMAPLSVIINDTYGWGMYFTACMFAIVGCFAGLNQFFHPGEKMVDHFSYASRYTDVVTDIDTEMVKYRQFRMNADVFVMKIKSMLDSRADNEPNIPLFILNGRASCCSEFKAFLCCCCRPSVQLNRTRSVSVVPVKPRSNNGKRIRKNKNRIPHR